MVFVVNENVASKIFEKYKNVAAFTMGKSKGFSDDEARIQVSYKKLSFLPSNDTINAVLSGDIKAKKVIANACKNVNRIKMDDEGNAIALNMLQLVSMLEQKPVMGEAMSKKDQKKYLKKYGPNVLVFVLDGEDPTKDKFLTKYIAALFGMYGYDIITRGKDVKKIFKGKRRKIYEKIRSMTGHKGFRMSGEGRSLYKLTEMYYSVELMQGSMAEVIPSGNISERVARRLAEQLIAAYSSLNIIDAVKMIGGGNKSKKKMAKMFKSKDREIFDAYEELRDILATMEIKLPKIKFGASKKKPEPKMNTKKFMKFFTKKKNRGLLRIIYVHTVCVLMGAETGSSEYNRHVADVLTKAFDSEFSKSYIATAKTYAKSTPVG